ncbi:NADPH-dependent FMN reductase [Pseudoleptotrichia goodfellowii]|uniref:Flavin reductase n=1 Tax=Pseudoleptotrichia goodfellowii F0264 TaxID=596323 RepID=D0GIZ4_9FUSO|nr:NADPH-dependent FMN reductase [Pseudoleptotrichia goodfellowii]EEY35945.1 flavin reductase [Pseudoleptotrichia goodfellowii F0264]MBF4805195.1 NAD(P)H-dependent oxidoreductase [Pseudoleptotrichia goodfellowii]
MSKKTVLLAVGSFRKNSFNQVVSDYIAEVLKEEGANVEFLDYRNVPLLEQDTEFPTPKEVISAKDQMRKADALWVVSPEYNGSYPAVVKNLLDWLSRPEKLLDYTTPTVIAGKPATVSGIAGSTGAKFVRENLSTLLGYIRMNPMPGTGVGLSVPAEAWQTGVLTLSDEQKNALKKQVKEFLEYIK